MITEKTKELILNGKTSRGLTDKDFILFMELKTKANNVQLLNMVGSLKTEYKMRKARLL